MGKQRNSVFHFKRYIFFAVLFPFLCPWPVHALKAVYNDSKTVDLYLDQGPVPSGDREMKLVIYRDYYIRHEFEYTEGLHWMYYSDRQIRPDHVYDYLVKYYIKDNNGQWAEIVTSNTVQVDSSAAKGRLYNGPENPFRRPPVSWSGRVNVAGVTVAQGTLNIKEDCEVTLKGNLIVGVQDPVTGKRDGHISAKNVIFKRAEGADSPEVYLKYQYAPKINPPIEDSEFSGVDYRIDEEGDLVKAKGLIFTNGDLVMEAPNGTISDVTLKGAIVIGRKWGTRTACILQNSSCDYIDVFSPGNIILNTTCRSMTLFEQAFENEIKESTFKALTIHGSDNLVSANEIVEEPFQDQTTRNSSDVTGGLHVYGSQNTIKANNFLSAYEGLTLKTDAYENIFTENVFTTAGVAVYANSGTRGNEIYNNVFRGRPVGYATAWDDSGENSWNKPKQPGKNIVGGKFLGGNYWGDYAGLDENEDGLGDTSYVIGGLTGVVDRLPLISPGVLMVSAGKFNPEKALLAPRGGAFVAAQIKLSLDSEALSSTEVTRMTFSFNGDSDLIDLLYQPRLYRKPVSGSGGEDFVAWGEQAGNQYVFAMQEKIDPGEETLFSIAYALKYTDHYIKTPNARILQTAIFPTSGSGANNCEAVFGATISAHDIVCSNSKPVGGIVIGSVIPKNSFYVSYFDSARGAYKGDVFEPSTLEILARWDAYDFMCDQGNTDFHLPIEGPSGKAHIWIKGQDRIHYLSKYGNVPSFQTIDCLSREDTGSSAPIAEALDVYFDEETQKLYWVQGRTLTSPYEDSCVKYDGDIFMEISAAEGGLTEFRSNVIFPLRERYSKENVITDSFELLDPGYEAEVRIQTHDSAVTAAGLVKGGPKVTIDRRKALIDYPAFYLSKPATPELMVNVEGNIVDLTWTRVDDANGYTLFYAPYPNADYIRQINMLCNTALSAVLNTGSAWYVAVKAYNCAGFSDYSNICHFVVGE
jgi:hypothetical protein